MNGRHVAPEYVPEIEPEQRKRAIMSRPVKIGLVAIAGVILLASVVILLM